MGTNNDFQTDDIGILPKSQYDMARWNESRMRRRMLEGLWEKDVRDRIKEYFSRVRELTLGKPSLGLNMFNSIVGQQAVLYDKAPTIESPEGTSDAQKMSFSNALQDAHLNQLWQRNNKYTIGIRENLMKLVWTAEGLRYNVVPADIVTATHAPQDPSTLTGIAEAVILSDGRTAWETWDISNPENPSMKLITPGGTDITSEVIKDPGVYMPRWGSGKPFLPYTLYHAQWSNKLWNPWDEAEIPCASLDLAVLWTMFGAIVRDASWPQRYVINLRLDGATVTKGSNDTARVGYIDTAPASLLVLKHIDKNATATAGQFEPGGDPEVIGRSIIAYMGVLLSNLGISPADLQSTPQAESGYAIQLKRSAQRREALKTIPNFMDGDTELLNKTAAMLNAYGGTSYPEDGWGISYNLPELGHLELVEELNTHEKLMTMGLQSKVETFLKMFPEWVGRSRDEVIEHLKMIAQENSELL